MRVILIRLVQAQVVSAAQDSDRNKTSQKEATDTLAAVPSVLDEGIPKKGARLLAWTKAAGDTYLRDPRHWTTEYAFNLIQQLFPEAPELLATWQQSVNSDAKVILLREQGRWKEAWDIVMEAIEVAHTGDRFAAQRLACRFRNSLRQHGDKLVATVSQSQALVEEDQSRTQLGL
jgi:hypothetical protein